MATYTVPVKLTANRQNAERIAEGLASFIKHLPSWGIKLQSITIDVQDGTVTIVTNNKIPADQLAHLNLSEVT